MTRNPPGPPSDAYQGGSYLSQQPQYGGEQAEYGSYKSDQGQSYGQHPTYGGQGSGYAQPYFGPQPYELNPNGSYGGERERYQSEAPPGASHVQPHVQQQAPYAEAPAYALQYAPQQGFPPYGQQYPPQAPQYEPEQGAQVAAFRSHFEEPHGPIDPNQPMPPPGSPPGAEDERGLMGALAGGAAGAYSGHKIGHGFLGAIGGAAVGSVAEDAWKKHKKHEEEGNLAHQIPISGGKPVKVGNFRASSKDVGLEDRCILVAECRDVHGHHHTSTLDLNDCLTNENGRLKWARGGNFAASSRHIRLIDDAQGLECECGDGCGGWQHNRIWLLEKITNENGRLKMID